MRSLAPRNCCLNSEYLFHLWQDSDEYTALLASDKVLQQNLRRRIWVTKQLLARLNMELETNFEYSRTSSMFSFSIPSYPADDLHHVRRKGPAKPACI